MVQLSAKYSLLGFDYFIALHRICMLLYSSTVHCMVLSEHSDSLISHYMDVSFVDRRLISDSVKFVRFQCALFRLPT